MSKPLGSADSITVVVKDQHDSKLYFKMRRDVPVRRVLVAFCKRKNLVYNSLKFLINGSRFQVNQTPSQLNMEDLDEIDVMSSMFGGDRANERCA